MLTGLFIGLLCFLGPFLLSSLISGATEDALRRDRQRQQDEECSREAYRKAGIG